MTSDDKKKTFDDFVGTDIDKEVESFIDTLFEEEKEIEQAPCITVEQTVAIVDNKRDVNVEIINPGVQQTPLDLQKSGVVTDATTTASQEDLYEEQFQFFITNLSEKLKPCVKSFLFIDGKESVTFSIETVFKKRGKSLEKCRQSMQKCFDGKLWNHKTIIIEAIKDQDVKHESNDSV